MYFAWSRLSARGSARSSCASTALVAIVMGNAMTAGSLVGSAVGVSDTDGAPAFPPHAAASSTRTAAVRGAPHARIFDVIVEYEAAHAARAAKSTDDGVEMVVPQGGSTRKIPRRKRPPSDAFVRGAAVAMLAVTALAAGAGAARWRLDPHPLSAAPCGEPVSAEEAASLGLAPIARELRGAWVSPVEGGEWPSRPNMSPEAQRAELLGVLDRAVALGLNAVVLHVRTAADAMYPTERAPWSSYLTRARGASAAPGYDPLAFAVSEAHRRGLQLHAWFNPFRAAPPDGDTRPGATFVARTHPKWIVRYGKQTWIDPGIPEARRAVLDAILEVVDRYDIDAVHLDDYFYPYQETRTVRHRVGRGRKRHTVVTHETLDFSDASSWARFGRKAGFDSRGAWRRANVNE